MMAFANPISSLASLNIVGIVTSAVLFGLAMVICSPASSPLFQLVKDINTLIMKILSWVIALLPIGIFAIIFDFTLKVGVSGELGGTFLTQLLQFGITVTIITLLHGIIILPNLAGIVTGQSPIALLKRAAQPLVVAFSTSSSSATLPVSLKTAEEQLGVDKSVSSFVLPLGATMKMDGTALFEAWRRFSRLFMGSSFQPDGHYHLLDGDDFLYRRPWNADSLYVRHANCIAGRRDSSGSHCDFAGH